MTKETFQKTLLDANQKYRLGNPIMSDQEFDNMLDDYRSKFGDLEYMVLRSKMFESAGKVKHPYKMGSLEKHKAEEPEEVISWIESHISTALNISAKVDGISCRLHYEDRKLVSATTRGDGEKGENLTDKILYVKGIKTTIDLPGKVDIRGELVCKTVDFEEVSDKFANPRNFCAGTMNRKEWTLDQVSRISFIPYTIFGTQFTKKEQFAILERNGFETAWHNSWLMSYVGTEIVNGRGNTLVEKLRSYAKQDFGYDCDGLVLSDNEYRNEDVLIPENQVAFKINELVGESQVIDVTWNDPSKNGRMSPIIWISPIELGGSVISKTTGNNIDYIKKMDIRYGSKVVVEKRGDIIPAITKVLENGSETEEIIPPEICPICGSKLVIDGVDLRCVNPECDAKQISSITSFIKKFEVKHSAKKQLENFGIKTIDDLISFIPNQAYKSEATLYNEIAEKIFTASPKKVFCAMNFKGLAEVQLAKIVDQYGLDWILSLNYIDSEKEKMLANLPVGIGEKSIETFWNSLKEAIDNTKKIMADSRYNYNTTSESTEVVKSTKNKGSICFTGALETMGRKEAQKLAEDSGFEVKGGVTKGLTYLVIADPNSTSSKARKARELGTKLLFEKEFLAMCRGEEQNIDEL